MFDGSLPFHRCKTDLTLFPSSFPQNVINSAFLKGLSQCDPIMEALKPDTPLLQY